MTPGCDKRFNDINPSSAT